VKVKASPRFNLVEETLWETVKFPTAPVKPAGAPEGKGFTFIQQGLELIVLFKNPEIVPVL